MAGLGDIMKQAQRLKAEMDRLQAEAATKRVEGSAGGGMVTVVAGIAVMLLSKRPKSLEDSKVAEKQVLPKIA